MVRENLLVWCQDLFFNQIFGRTGGVERTFVCDFLKFIWFFRFITYFYVTNIMKAPSIPSLTRAEEDIMQIIWQLGSCLVRNIIDNLGQPDIPHSTVSSVVRILEKKGFVTHKAYGKTHEYYPAITKEEYAQQNVSSLISKYFGGSPNQLVSFLVDKNNLDLNELNNIMQSLSTSKKK